VAPRKSSSTCRSRDVEKPRSCDCTRGDSARRGRHRRPAPSRARPEAPAARAGTGSARTRRAATRAQLHREVPTAELRQWAERASSPATHAATIDTSQHARVHDTVTRRDVRQEHHAYEVREPAREHEPHEHTPRSRARDSRRRIAARAADAGAERHADGDVAATPGAREQAAASRRSPWR
jgi:hypothetical protein